MQQLESKKEENKEIILTYLVLDLGASICQSSPSSVKKMNMLMGKCGVKNTKALKGKELLMPKDNVRYQNTLETSVET